MSGYSIGDYLKINVGSAGYNYARIKKISNNGRFVVAVTDHKHKVTQKSVSPANHVKVVDRKEVPGKLADLIDTKYEQMTEDFNVTDSRIVDLAVEKKPEDFRAAVESALSERLRDEISDARQDIAAVMFGEETDPARLPHEKKDSNVGEAEEPKAKNPGAKGHIQTDEKKTGDKSAEEPKAKNPGAMGHIQTDEKKTGKTKAAAPVAEAMEFEGELSGKKYKLVRGKPGTMHKVIDLKTKQEVGRYSFDSDSDSFEVEPTRNTRTQWFSTQKEVLNWFETKFKGK